MTGDRNISIGSGNYKKRIKGDYIQGNYYYNAAQEKNLAQAAAEIQELLEQLNKSYDTSAYSGKEKVASETIKKIENNPELKARIISALKEEKYEQAEPLFQQALELRKQLLGEDHPEYATSLNNLANLYSNQGKYEQAEPLYIQALKLKKQLLAENHPDGSADRTIKLWRCNF